MARDEAGSEKLLMQEFFTASARGLVDAQIALDARARASLIDWEEEGRPPSAFYWSSCRLRFPVSWQFVPRSQSAERTHMQITPRSGGRGSVTFSIKYIPSPQEY